LPKITLEKTDKHATLLVRKHKCQVGSATKVHDQAENVAEPITDSEWQLRTTIAEDISEIKKQQSEMIALLQILTNHAKNNRATDIRH